MSLTIDLMQTRIVIASDCKEVIKNIEKGTGGMHGQIIHEIKYISSEFQACSFLSERRASNIEVHNLAKHTLGLSE